MGWAILKIDPVGSVRVAIRPKGVSSAAWIILPAQGQCGLDGGVGVLDGEIDLPVRWDALGQEAGGVHDAGLGVIACAKGGIAELRCVAHDVRVPAEDVLVELYAGVVVAGEKLEPGR